MATCTPPAQTCAGHHNSFVVSAALINRPQNSKNIDVGSCELVSCGCESAHRPMCRSVGVSHRSSPSISHVIRSSDKLAMSRKPQNSNDVDSKFERVAGELRAKLRWGSGTPGIFGSSSAVSGPRTLRSVGQGHRMITILIHIHVRST